MPNIYPLQDDFSAGEITPRLRGKTRSDAYQKGLAFCENFEVTPQGSLEMRGGTQFVGVLTDLNAVLHTYRRRIGNDVIVAIGETEISLWNRDGPVVGEGANLIRDPEFWGGLNQWDSQELVTDNNFAEVVPIFGVGVRTKSVYNGGQFYWLATAAVSQLFTTPSIAVLHDFSCKATVRPNGLGKEAKGQLQIDIREPDGPSLFSFIRAYNLYDNSPPDGFVFEVSGQFTPVGDTLTIAMNTTFPIDLGSQSIPAGMNIEFSEITCTVTNSVPAPIVFPTPETWNGKLNRIQVCQDSGINRMFFVCFEGDMYELNYDPDADDWLFGEFIPLTDPVDLWTEVDNRDQPYTCAIHQGRLWLGGTPQKTSTLWASETWNYDNFVPATNPADPLEFTLTSNGAIQWIHALKFLLIGTDVGEVIGRSTGAVITNSDFDFPLEQTWGSTFIQPTQVGSTVMYVTGDASRVRSLFDGGDVTNGYDSEDINIVSGHITAARITDIVFQQNPDYYLSTRLANGIVATSCFYQAGDVNAWFRFVGKDTFLSLTSSNEDIGTSLWVLVNRITAQNEQITTLEVKNAGNISGYNLDSYAVRTSSDIGIVTGLDHLNSQTCGVVQIIGDEYTLLPQQIPENGQIVVPEIAYGSTILVGIPYTATAITLPIEGSNKEGTAQVQSRRFSEVFLRLFDSGIPKINGQRPPIRNPPTPMNISEPLFTGDTALHQVGWNGGVITIEQDLPLPTNITAIFGKVKGSAV